MSLLSPHDRTALLDALRPPPGYALHTAIGTTFSLDLVAMLSAPVGFTFFDLEGDSEGFGEQAPLELLEAIRRHAGQLLIFCQAGRISVPPTHRPLFSYLEDRIVQSKAPKEGRAFHPKLWVIRFVAEDGAVVYRLLCKSRNLTFDRSLDTMLVLDGDLKSDRSVGFAVNRDLRGFLEALPGMAVSELTERQRTQCELVAAEIAKVDWSMDGLPIEGFTFWPLGHEPKRTWPFRDAGSRLLIASPFVSAALLQRICRDARESILISRRSELDKLDSAALSAFRDVHVLRAQPETAESDESDRASDDNVAPQDLHAKLYIADRGWDASIWTGSANATNAAFDGNVEFLVELLGKKSQLGIDAFLAKTPGSVGVMDLLEPYVAPDVHDTDDEMEALDARLEGVRRALATVPWTISVAPGQRDEEFTVVASMAADVSIEAGVAVSVRLLSMSADSARPFDGRGAAGVSFEHVSLEGLSAFLVIDLTGRMGDRSRSVSFVVNATLVGEPPNRRERILQSMLKDKRSVVRFLLLLLAEASDASGDTGGAAGSFGGSSAGATWESEALFEPLLRTFERDPARLTSVATLVRDLAGSPETSTLVPEGLASLIEVLEAARQEGHL